VNSQFIIVCPVCSGINSLRLQTTVEAVHRYRATGPHSAATNGVYQSNRLDRTRTATTVCDDCNTAWPGRLSPSRIVRERPE
jgi:hypothetical protein